MPGRHVHFTDVFPSTPSSTYSYTSLPTPGGPITPPPLQHAGSPYACSPLPSIPSQIHPALGASRTPCLHYDVSLPPSTVKPGHPSISPRVLTEPATHPPLPFMTIISPYLPWPIVVTSPSKTGTYITVADVLDAIYHSLRLGVSGVEFQNIPSQGAQHRVNDAYRHRYKRIGDARAYEQEKAKGLKRVDFLMDKNTFVGLSSTSRGPDVWELNIS